MAYPVARYARKYRIPLPLANALIGQESGGRAGVRSSAGATGLTQVMPATFVGMYGGTEAQAIERLKNPEVALDAGFRYLRRQMDAFKNWRDALAAYNAGPGRVKDGSWLKIAETRNYVHNLLRYASGGVAERVDAPASSPGALGRGGSSPPPATFELPNLSPLASQGLQRVASGERYDAVAALGDTARAYQEAQGQASMAVPDLPPEARQQVDQRRAPHRAPQGVIGRAIKVAAAQIGKPYVWGGESPQEGGFDCSGLIDWAFRQAGVDFPGRLTTYSAMQVGRSVKGKGFRPGDLIIANGGRHMVMYVGGGRVIAAPHAGAKVQYQSVSSFKGSIVDVRRVG